MLDTNACYALSQRRLKRVAGVWRCGTCVLEVSSQLNSHRVHFSCRIECLSQSHTHTHTQRQRQTKIERIRCNKQSNKINDRFNARGGRAGQLLSEWVKLAHVEQLLSQIFVNTMHLYRFTWLIAATPIRSWWTKTWFWESATARKRTNKSVKVNILTQFDADYCRAKVRQNIHRRWPSTLAITGRLELTKMYAKCAFERDARLPFARFGLSTRLHHRAHSHSHPYQDSRESVTAFSQYIRPEDMKCVGEMLQVVINMPMSCAEVKLNCNF